MMGERGPAANEGKGSMLKMKGRRGTTLIALLIVAVLALAAFAAFFGFSLDASWAEGV